MTSRHLAACLLAAALGPAIAQHAGLLAASSEELSAVSHQMAATAEEMNGFVEQLQRTVSFFQVGNGAPMTAVINESAAKRLFPNEDAVGKSIGIGRPENGGNFQPFTELTTHLPTAELLNLSGATVGCEVRGAAPTARPAA